MAAGLKGIRKRLMAAAERGLGVKKSDQAKVEEQLLKLGIQGVGINSDDTEIEDFERKLWEGQDPFVDELHREWKKILDYIANRQHIAWNKDARRWIPKKTVPWRVRETYNVMSKAKEIRTSRLTENKPSVSVIAGGTDQSDIDAAEYKESLFWALWNQLKIHGTIVDAREWATETGSGFLKGTYDAEAGCEYAATKKRRKFKQMPKLGPDGVTPLLDPMTQQPVMMQVYDGIEEYYVGPNDEDLGPVFREEEDLDSPTPGAMKQVRNDPPDGVEWLFEGWPDLAVRPPFSIRYDQYVDKIYDSWYVQDADIMPGTKVVAMWPDKIEELREAKPASDDEKALHWKGMSGRQTFSELGGPQVESTDRNNDLKLLDREYLVRETWIFPKNQLIRDLWGRKGVKIITVGGKLVQKDPLPEWARERCPFIQLVDQTERGNHYGRTLLRDLLPLQDSINRSRSMMAERQAILSRLILHTVQNHQMNIKMLGGLPGVLLTTKTAEAKPTPLHMGSNDPSTSEFYRSSLEAAGDVGNMNPASTGKLPSAGLAAKAIYALQYADERSISKPSTLQDEALRELALLLDSITRHEWTHERKVKIVGEDRSFMVEVDIRPEMLKANVDYFFVPGSMMSRQKEAIKNEVLELKSQGLLQPWEARKWIATVAPEAFRRSHSLQETKARRNLERLLKGDVTQIQPDPWEDPDVGAGVLEEFMLTRKWEYLGDTKKQAVAMLWQAYQVMRQQRAAQQQAAAARAGGQPGGGGPGQPGAGGAPAAGAAELEQTATEAMEQPEPAGA
jgi:hypothetical protein